MHASEHATTLCPASVCPPHRNVQLGSMLEEAVDTWIPGATEGAFGSEGLPEEAADAERRVDELDLRPGERPHLVVHHIALPHQPWRLDAGGTAYEASNPPSGLHLTGWTGWGQDVGRQRHVLQLQATDRLLGRYLDGCGRRAPTTTPSWRSPPTTAPPSAATRSPGVERDTTTDHVDAAVRQAPRQAEGAIDDRDVRSIDLLPRWPTCRVEVPWSVDGEVVGAARTGTVPPSPTSPPPAMTGNRRGRGFVESTPAPASPGCSRRPRRVGGRGPGSGSAPRTATSSAGDRDLRVARTPTAGRPRDTTDDDVDVDEPLPIEVVGSTACPRGGRGGRAQRCRRSRGRGRALRPTGGGRPAARYLSLVLPRLIVQGDNDVGLFVVEGQVGGEVLHPVPLDGA